MLPRFLGLGAQKGGTTTLQQLLDHHPGVFLPACKEVHYYSLHFGEGEAWYRAHFHAATAAQVCGDITPYYLFHPAAPVRIRAQLPQARLIVLLRDPVERAFSQFFHSRRLGLEPLELAEALAAEPQRLAGAEEVLASPQGRHRSHQEHSYLSRSRYEQQLARYEALFPAEQLLLLRSEDLFTTSEQLWLRLLRFLELEAAPLPAAAAAVRANAGRGEAQAVDPALRQMVRQALAPTYLAMAERYDIHWP